MKWRPRVNTRRKIKGLPVLFFALFQNVLGPTGLPGQARPQQHPPSGKQQSQENIGGETGSDVVAVSRATHLVIGSVIVFFLPCSGSGSGSKAAAAAGA